MLFEFALLGFLQSKQLFHLLKFLHSHYPIIPAPHMFIHPVLALWVHIIIAEIDLHCDSSDRNFPLCSLHMSTLSLQSARFRPLSKPGTSNRPLGPARPLTAEMRHYTCRRTLGNISRSEGDAAPTICLLIIVPSPEICSTLVPDWCFT